MLSERESLKGSREDGGREKKKKWRRCRAIASQSARLIDHSLPRAANAPAHAAGSGTSPGKRPETASGTGIVAAAEAVGVIADL
ncbi:hypothetical protein [Phaffia rhodozyma]|uniref:Uncharacterized protein n=1 Tax=Phaffia rhodozyma TaxID=264483 RepID=A0A0F7SH55_PHARH|nr:hypothetical protein [Phaffia rhodozyma]